MERTRESKRDRIDRGERQTDKEKGTEMEIYIGDRDKKKGEERD